MAGGRRAAVAFVCSPVKVPCAAAREEASSTGRVEFSFPEAPLEPSFLLRTASISANRKKAKTSEPLLSLSQAAATIPIEQLRVKRVRGDGRCLFRALAQGVARHKGIFLSVVKEEMEADNLRMAVREALCTSREKKQPFKDVIKGIEQLEDPMPRYCRRLKSENFWGGEPELIVLSALLKVPIYVYKEEQEYGKSGTGFIRIVEYGTEWTSKTQAKRKPKQPVKLLYSGSNHYDLLID